MAEPVDLSPRQQQVFRELLQDLSNKEIASNLNMAERTVKFHVSALLLKFGVSSRRQLRSKGAELLGGQFAYYAPEPEASPIATQPADTNRKPLQVVRALDRRARA
jgi:DNA-binding CsgD family transcriptional regulator